ncbi:MAG: ATP-dependent helicase C-terminal domain-containing protein, partial [Pseudomonadota bacterium]
HPPHKSFTDAPLFVIPRRVLPIESHYLNRGVNVHDRKEFDQRLAEVCAHALDTIKSGNLLVFLAGSGEIQRAHEALLASGVEKQFGVEIHRLFSKAKADEQKRALSDSPQRKVILSTNIAETSLTIPNVRGVVDTGLHKEASYNPKSGVETLALRRIALDSAIQRAGRSGRLSAGHCFKMWTRADEQRFRKQTPAEIHRVDPVDLILKVMSFGADPKSFDFFEAPDQEHWALAMRRLETSECVLDGKMTNLGRWVAQFPGDLSEALLVAVSQDQKFMDEALLTTLILQEGDPAPFLTQNNNHEDMDDLRSRLAWLKEKQSHHYHDLLKKLKKQIGQKPLDQRNLPELESLEEAIAFSLSHRLCRFRNEKRKSAVMTTGRGVKLAYKEISKKTDFFVALQILDRQLHGQAESEVQFAYGVSKKTIQKVYEKQIETTTNIEKAGKKGLPKAYVFQSLWDMPMEEPRGLPLEKEHMITHFKSAFAEDYKKSLKDFPESLEFVEKFLFCKHHVKDMEWPELSTEEWDLIVEAAYSETNELNLADKTWLEAIQMLFSQAQLDFILSFAPSSMATSRRKKNEISYEDPTCPKVSLIIQEAFELLESPTIGHGQVPLAVELLAPSRRPIEISRDMAQFWISSYPDIRKQYRGRYPKHSWPEEIK